MSTGSKHKRTTEIAFDDEGNEKRRYFVESRCTLGEDHDDDAVLPSQCEDDEDEDQVISASDAADIWLSRGMDEDHTFGYSEDELRRAGARAGRLPARELFDGPRYNSWIEMPYAPTQEGVLDYADGLLDAGFPPGVLMIDDRWSADYGDWRFDASRFPDPAAMVEQLQCSG